MFRSVGGLTLLLCLLGCGGRDAGTAGPAGTKTLLAELDEAFAEAHRSVNNMKRPDVSDLSHVLDDVRAAIGNLQRQAASDSPAQATMSGMLQALDALEKQLAKKGPASLSDFRTTFDKLKEDIAQLRKSV